MIDLPPVKLFISYSHKDEALKNRFDIALKPLKRLNLIDVWQDNLVLPGEEFEKTIFNEISKADVICLLVSPHFIDSDYCFTKEMEEALKHRRENGISVVPILLTATPLWKRFEIGKLSALPKDGKPVDDWDNSDAAWVDVVHKISELVDHIQRNAPRRMSPSVKEPEPAPMPGIAVTGFPLMRQKVSQGKVKEVIAELIKFTEQGMNDEHNTAVLLSTRWHLLAGKEASGTIGDQTAQIERNKISMAVLHLIEVLETNQQI
jgi:hypothetical protein